MKPLPKRPPLGLVGNMTQQLTDSRVIELGIGRKTPAFRGIRFFPRYPEFSDILT
jgi:hypothetical protein